MSLEVVTFTTPETYIYSIPPLKSNRGHKASEWDVDNPMWKGRLTVIELENSDTKELTCELKLEDKETGELFAKAPYSYNGKGVESVMDSSRFFAIRVVDGERHAVLGMGFQDRSIAFEFNIALETFRKHTSVEEETKTVNDQPKKDFSLKAGEKIHINLGDSKTKKSMSTENSGETDGSNASIPTLLPPPPSSGSGYSSNVQGKANRNDPFDDDFGDFVG